jgi:hypothetical protein
MNSSTSLMLLYNRRTMEFSLSGTTKLFVVEKFEDILMVIL